MSTEGTGVLLRDGAAGEAPGAPPARGGVPGRAASRLDRRRPVLVALVVLALAGTFPMMVSYNAEWLTFMTLALVYAIATDGLRLLYGSGGIMSVAQGALVGCSGYATALLILSAGLAVPLAIVLAIVVSVAAAALLTLPTFRVGDHYFLVITFAFAEIIAGVGDNVSITGGVNGLSFVDSLHIGPLNTSDPSSGYYLVLIVAVVCSILTTIAVRSRFGFRLSAVRQNAKLSTALGISSFRHRLLAFVIAGALAGVAGVLWVYNVQYLTPDQFNGTFGITLVLAIMIGGSQNPYGPIIGSAIVLIGPQLLGLQGWENEVVLGCIFIVVILVFPHGIGAGLSTGWRRHVRHGSPLRLAAGRARAAVGQR